MPDINRYMTAAEIINYAAAEMGLSPSSDVFAETDEKFVSLRYLLTSVGRELLAAYDWQQLTYEETLTVNYGTAGEYALPTDFDRMINQTGWDRTNAVMIDGPASAQTWQYLLAQGDDPVYCVFRFNQDLVKILPVPPASGSDPYLVINYEYISRGWVQSATDPARYMDFVEANGDTVLYDSTLMVKFLKLRFLEAKGFDTTAALAQFTTAFEMATGKNMPAPILSLLPARTFPWIDPASFSNIGS